MMEDFQALAERRMTMDEAVYAMKKMLEPEDEDVDNDNGI